MSDDIYIEFLFWERYKSKDFFQESDEGLHLIFQDLNHVRVDTAQSLNGLMTPRNIPE